MATKRPAKIASSKKGKKEVRMCPACQSEMQITKLIRVSGPSGMFWVCQSAPCSTLVATSGAVAGQLQLS